MLSFAVTVNDDDDEFQKPITPCNRSDHPMTDVKAIIPHTIYCILADHMSSRAWKAAVLCEKANKASINNITMNNQKLICTRANAI
jgi:hypothetical protein